MDNGCAYFDQAAAARPDERAVAKLAEFWRNCYVNQEAAHLAAYGARQQLDRAAEELSLALCGEKRFAVWGNSGSELFNLLAASPAAAGKTVALCSVLEHPALVQNFRRQAGKIVELICNSLAEVQFSGEKADFLALHAVQSEIGVRQEYDRIASEFRRRNPGAVCFCDAIQAAGKLILPREPEIIAVSGHKFGSPGGAALLIKPEWPQAPEFLKFAHAYRHTGYFCGRPEVPVLLAMSYAAKLAAAEREENFRRISGFNHELRTAWNGLVLPGGGKLRFLLPAEKSSPYLLHLLLPGMQSGVVVRMLSEAGVLTAAGSACASEVREPSAVLKALKVDRNALFAGLRVSFGLDSSPGEVKKLREVFASMLKNY